MKTDGPPRSRASTPYERSGVRASTKKEGEVALPRLSPEATPAVKREPEPEPEETEIGYILSPEEPTFRPERHSGCLNARGYIDGGDKRVWNDDG